jgi:iron complex transport system permease protein
VSIAEIAPAQDNSIWLLRMPRVMLAVVVGAAMSVVGVAMQAMVPNPIDEPYLLGVSSGASVGAVLVILFGWFAFWGKAALVGVPFLFGLASFAVVFALSQKGGRSVRCESSWSVLPNRTCRPRSPFHHVACAKSDRYSERPSLWQAGSIAGANWERVVIPSGALAIGIVVQVAEARAFNALVSNATAT